MPRLVCIVSYSYIYKYNYKGIRVQKVFVFTLDDQTQVDSKPAGQPEHASLNQCQLIAANRPKLMLWAQPAGGGDKVSLSCNRCESPGWSLFPRDFAVTPYLVLLA